MGQDVSINDDIYQPGIFLTKPLVNVIIKFQSKIQLLPKNSVTLTLPKEMILATNTKRGLNVCMRTVKFDAANLQYHQNLR